MWLFCSEISCRAWWMWEWNKSRWAAKKKKKKIFVFSYGGWAEAYKLCAGAKEHLRTLGQQPLYIAAILLIHPLICKEERDWMQPAERAASSGSARSHRESKRVLQNKPFVRLYLLKSSKQMSFCSLVFHEYVICCCMSSYTSQFLE